MKPFIEHLRFEGKPIISYEQQTMEIFADVVFERRKRINKQIIREIFEKYRDTPIAEVYVLDETEFEKFLAKMLPIYMKGETK